MKKNILFILVLFNISMANSWATNYYVATNGNDSNSGTSTNSSFQTLSKAINQASSGDTIYLRGGNHNYNSTLVITKNGSSSAKINVFAYNNEIPILNFSMSEGASNRGIVLDGDYWHWRGITIQGAGDNGMLLSGNNNTIENCTFRNNKDTGLQLSRYSTSANSMSQWPTNNLILGCESYDNKDSGNENADGFAAKLTCGTGNIFRNCVAHHNIDDGWDLYTKSDTGPIGVIVLEGCIAHHNGTLTTGGTSGGGDKNGYKLGSSAHQINHIVRRCIAFNNGKHGFTDNGNIGAIEFTNNTSYNNEGYNWHTRDGASHVFKNNLSFDNATNDRIRGNSTAPNSFIGATGGFSVTSSDFVTLTMGSNANPTGNGFLNLNVSSDLIDAGVTSTGITYTGSKPDLGAIESGTTNGGGGTAEILLTAAGGNGSINLNWSISNLNVTGLEIYRDTDSNPSGRVRIAQVVTTTRNYTDSNVSNGTTYYYWIKANASINSNVASATPTGSNGGGSTSNQIHNFTVSEKNSSFYTISGNMNATDGFVNYNGLNLTRRLKIESSTSIVFSTTVSATLTLVFDSNFTGNIKVDNVSYAASSGIATISIASGSHTITKDNVANLYYMSTTYNSNRMTNEEEEEIINEADIVIYPNPAQDDLQIKLPNKYSNGTITVIDLTGKEILKGSIENNQNRVDISHLKSGIYILKINSTTGSYTKPFIKE